MWRKPEEAKPSSKPAEKREPSSSAVSTSADSTSAVHALVSNFASTPQPSAPENSPEKDEPSVAAESSPSHISSGLKIRGEITGTSDLLIDGDIQGKIQMRGCKLTVGPTGRVKSDIEAREIHILGRVDGNLKAAESVAIGNSGRLEGSVVTRRISIDDGARLRGKVEMIRVESSAPAKSEDSPKHVAAASAATAPADSNSSLAVPSVAAAAAAAASSGGPSPAEKEKA